MVMYGCPFVVLDVVLGLLMLVFTFLLMQNFKCYRSWIFQGGVKGKYTDSSV